MSNSLTWEFIYKENCTNILYHLLLEFIQAQPSPVCVWDYKLDIGNHSLFQDLKICLDPKKPFGNDYRTLAEEFGYSVKEIKYFGTLDSPTVSILEEQMSKCTLLQLCDILVGMDRDDAKLEVEKVVKTLKCSCGQCKAF